MKTGIFGKKAHIHYEAAPCINEWLDTLDAESIDKADIYRIIAEHIDKEIHRNYRIYPANIVALAEVSGDESLFKEVTEQEHKEFEAYLKERISMVKVENPDEPFLREKILTMYANPLKNHIKSKEE